MPSTFVTATRLIAERWIQIKGLQVFLNISNADLESTSNGILMLSSLGQASDRCQWSFEIREGQQYFFKLQDEKLRSVKLSDGLRQHVDCDAEYEFVEELLQGKTFGDLEDTMLTSGTGEGLDCLERAVGFHGGLSKRLKGCSYANCNMYSSGMTTEKTERIDQYLDSQVKALNLEEG